MDETNKKAAFNNEDCQSKIILHAEKILFAGKSFIPNQKDTSKGDD